VDILFACADMPADLIYCSMEKGAAGIVIAGGGNGNMNAATMDRAARAARAGLVVVRGSRTPTGKVGRNVEVDDDRLGFVVSDALNPPKARILLMLALLKKRGLDEIQRLFYEY
jgi:L-asparaginase